MPIKLLERVKAFLWKLFEPLFPTVRDTWVFLGFIKHDERQNFPLGWLRGGASVRDLRQQLTKAGFSHDYLGWVDPDEVLNMRQAVDTIYQYHVRLYKDGEVRGHYELTPESHPFKHLHEKGMVDGASYLEPLLGPLLDPAPRQSSAAPGPTPRPPHSAASRRSGSGADQ